MKKIKLFLLASFALFFTSCQDPIFYNILQDVPPETATINGIINSITRYQVNSQEYLVTNSNDGLVYKKADEEGHGKWNTYKYLPFTLNSYDYYGDGFSGQQILKTVADENYLYIVTVSYKEDTDEGIVAPDNFYIWAAKITDWDSNVTWTNVVQNPKYNNKPYLQSYYYKSYEDNSGYHTRFNVFCSNDIRNNHRVAYIRSEDEDGAISYYKLNGTSTPTPKTISITVDANELTNNVNGVAFIGNLERFFSTSAVTTNATASKNSSIIYYSIGTDLYTYNGTTSTFVMNAGEEISCLAYTKDALLIGRANYSNVSSSKTNSRGGIVKVSLTNDIPSSDFATFTTNAQSQLSSSYLINSIINVDTTKTELESTLYAAICFRGSGTSSAVTFDNVGLWSYYPSRGNWNRE